MKKNATWKTLVRLSGLFFKAVPFNCCLALIISGLFMFYYSYSVQITADLFESVEAFVNAKGVGVENVIHNAVLFVAMDLLFAVLIFLGGVNANVFIYRKANIYFRQKLASKAAKIPLISYEDAAVSEMLTRAQTVVEDEKLSDQFDSIQDLIRGFFSMIGIAVVLAGYSPWLLAIAIPSVLPFLVVRMVRGKEFYKMKYFQAKTKRHMDYYWGLLFQKESRKEMQVYGFGHYIKEKWSRYRDDVDEKTWKFKSRDSAIMLLLSSITVVGYIASIGLSVYLMWDGQINVGVLGACLSGFLSMQSQTKKFLICMGIIYEETQFNQDYLDFISLPEARNGSIILDQMPKVIEMKQVSFRYPNSERATIQDVSVKIRQGESVVLVGENGSGKSTLVKLLLGLYECESGEVLLDKIPMTQIQKESLYDRLSLMMQNSLNYKATVREAVALADQKGADDEQRIWKALQQAKIDDIAGEEGLDTRIGNEFSGKELSGGQWQKLALARALYKNSDFVVLDEPTSAIDPLTEMEILKTFLSNFKGRTSIIVSHRVGICTCADKIVVMKEGRLTECGTHEELMKKQGVYYEMFHTQAKWYN